MGKTAKATMEFDLLTETSRYDDRGLPGVFDEWPGVGSLPVRELEALASVLTRHTGAADVCWFASWEGWDGQRRDVRAAPTFELPGRRYHLLTGPIASAAESVDRDHHQSWSLWWPDDHAWCVATEIDFDTTYIGCSDPCAREILAEPALDHSA